MNLTHDVKPRGLVETLNRALRKARRLARQLLGKCPRYRIQIDCHREFHGSEYGGWTIFPNKISRQSIVYSFGIGEDISFDLSLIDKYGVIVFAFDPTPKSISWLKSQKLPEEYHFFEFGVADYDGTAKFYPPENPEHVSHTLLNIPGRSRLPIDVEVHKLETIMRKFDHHRIDILKMNIEGAEYAVIQDMLDSDLDIPQILVGFHHDFPSVGVARTKHAVQLLNLRGYRIFHISDTGNEYSFIRA